MIGINDFSDALRSPDALFLTYQSMVSRLEHNAIRFVMLSTLPCNEVKSICRSRFPTHSSIRWLNTRLATLTCQRLSFVEMVRALVASGGLRDQLTYRGRHPIGQSYQFWKSAPTRIMPSALPGHRSSP